MEKGFVTTLKLLFLVIHFHLHILASLYFSKQFVYSNHFSLNSFSFFIFRERKIALRGKNSQELIELQKKAEALYLPTYLVQDAGKTQVPVGSTTVLAIFGDEEAVNEVTGKLKLL